MVWEVDKYRINLCGVIFACHCHREENWHIYMRPKVELSIYVPICKSPKLHHKNKGRWEIGTTITKCIRIDSSTLYKLYFIWILQRIVAS